MLHPPARDIVVVHSSDLHVDHDYTARLHGGDGTAGLGCVLAAARDLAADVVLLAGDTFDSHRVPQDLIEQAAAVIGAAALPVVILPGNHDPAIASAIYRDGALAAVKNLHIIGVTHDEVAIAASPRVEKIAHVAAFAPFIVEAAQKTKLNPARGFARGFFAKLVPNVRKLGLLDANNGYLREKWGEAGLLEFEFADDTGSDYESYDAVAQDRAAQETTRG